MDDNQECQELWIQKRILWSSNQDEPDDYYADKLTLHVKDDSEFCLRLNVSGRVYQTEIKDIFKYV